MDRETLIAALVGALIATVPILITNVVQIVLHISENRQKEKDAKIQNRQKWIEHDVLMIMDSVDQILKYPVELQSLYFQREILQKGVALGEVTPDELAAKQKIILDRVLESYNNISLKAAVINKLVYSFDDAMYTSAYEFSQSVDAFMKKRGEEVELGFFTMSTKSNDGDAKWTDMMIKAGEFHRALRDKLISLRD